ncbi:MAG TPA: rod shape-determining protein RodA [Gemmatimonadetes bacterium]|nr:rod shape-determining protein RodA [Gemmatimonadota bacterium]
MIPSRLALLGLMLVACSDSASVQIVLPDEGPFEEGSSVMVTLEVSGLTIASAGTTDPGTGHHHLMIDRDLPVGGLPIPSFQGQVHLGQGQLEYEIEGLDAGEHVVIAVVGDGTHIPLDPWVVDTVRFVIE